MEIISNSVSVDRREPMPAYQSMRELGSSVESEQAEATSGSGCFLKRRTPLILQIADCSELAPARSVR